MAFARRVFWVSAVAVLGCGGKAVIDAGDGPGGGGAGGGTTTTTTTTTTTSTTTTTTTTVLTCDGLYQVLEAAIASAVACDPLVNMVQCDGSAVIHDPCGCPVLANETSPAAVEAATDAYDAWTGAGCGPYLCGLPCQPMSAGLCMATSGSSGTCVVAIW
ncbi:MAG: hypothetical protein HY908_00405 [Myxococcales bacterium]|nr:hypothetical protein [Myxococcales bacterium]